MIRYLLIGVALMFFLPDGFSNNMVFAAQRGCLTKAEVDLYKKGGWHRYTKTRNGKTYRGKFQWKANGKAVSVVSGIRYEGSWRQLGNSVTTKYPSRKPNAKERYRVKKNCP